MQKETILGAEEKKKSVGLIHKVALAQQKTSRNYTASTKTKSEVRGGGRKPWKQKGSGQARAGSTRSPLWVGGGVIFGPKPRKITKKVNKKERRLAILSALYLKEQQLRVINEQIFEEVGKGKRTKSIVDFLSSLEILKSKRILFVLSKPNREFWLATRNLPNVEVTTGNCLHINQLLNANQIILSTASLELINFTYGNSQT